MGRSGEGKRKILLGWPKKLNEDFWVAPYIAKIWFLGYDNWPFYKLKQSFSTYVNREALVNVLNVNCTLTVQHIGCKKKLYSCIATENIHTLPMGVFFIIVSAILLEIPLWLCTIKKLLLNPISLPLRIYNDLPCGGYGYISWNRTLPNFVHLIPHLGLKNIVVVSYPCEAAFMLRALVNLKRHSKLKCERPSTCTVFLPRFRPI